MASKKVFYAMEAEDWNKVKELIAATSWTPQALEEKHGRWEERTLLTKAAEEGQEDIIQLLLDTGADIEAKSRDGWTALHHAARGGHLPALQLLLDRGADIEAKDWWCQTALHWAARGGHFPALQLLLDRGADIEAKDNDGRTALVIAASNCHSEVVALLIERGEIINVQTMGGQTALILSVMEGHVAVAKLLCCKGADLTIKDNEGYDALYKAERNLRNENRRLAAEEIIAVLKGEAEWRRVKNFVEFLQTGGLSSADWSVRRLLGGGSMPATDGTAAAAAAAAAHPDIPVSLSGSKRQVMENRDLCRIVASYIPKPL